MVDAQQKVNVLVRLANQDDVSQMVALGEKFHAKSSLAEFGSFVPSDFSKMIEAILCAQAKGALFVADGENGLVGMAGAVYFPLYFNFSVMVAQEVFLWAEMPGLGMRLLGALEANAIENGVSGFMTGSIAGLREEAVGRAYRMRGYRPVENSYMRKLSV